jgi:apolipoprotein N-acyltransferase
MVIYYTPTLALPHQGGGEKRGVKGGITVEPLPKERVMTPPLKKEDRGGFVYSLSLLVTTALLLLFTLVYGYFTITTPITGNKVKISLVQGNIEQKKKWDLRFAREIMQIYSELTDEVLKNKPALIIWPETATPGSITQNPWLYMEIGKIVKNTGTALLFGSAQHQKFKEKGTQIYKYSNSAYLIDPETQPGRNQRYDKIRLFPFGEYLPYKEVIPWSHIGVSGLDNYLPGKEYTVFKHSVFRFGVIICWENVFPDLVRQFVKHGAQCIINLTNEAHFGKTAAPHQLVSISVFRAVENRIYVVRCANTGVSCIIDPYGRILDRVKDERGDDTFVRGTMTGCIIPLESRTIYTQYGDWLVWVAIVGSLVFLVVSFIKKRE